ncbi:MAG TPA: hypothetical protein VFG43_13250, partial [Geminicoccaceae bacterium]|nr:hypothetical protein [Geminicoccaceae bacterium]
MGRIIAGVIIASATSGSSAWSLDRRRPRPSRPGVLPTTRRRGGPTGPAPPGMRRTVTGAGPSGPQAGERDGEAVVDAVGRRRTPP